MDTTRGESSRKWYGQSERLYLVDWENDGRAIRDKQIFGTENVAQAAKIVYVSNQD